MKCFALIATVTLATLSIAQAVPVTYRFNGTIDWYGGDAAFFPRIAVGSQFTGHLTFDLAPVTQENPEDWPFGVIVPGEALINTGSTLFMLAAALCGLCLFGKRLYPKTLITLLLTIGIVQATPTTIPFKGTLLAGVTDSDPDFLEPLNGLPYHGILQYDLDLLSSDPQSPYLPGSFSITITGGHRYSTSQGWLLVGGTGIFGPAIQFLNPVPEVFEMAGIWFSPDDLFIEFEDPTRPISEWDIEDLPSFPVKNWGIVGIAMSPDGVSDLFGMGGPLNRVPDAGSTIMLLGGVLSVLDILRRRGGVKRGGGFRGWGHTRGGRPRAAHLGKSNFRQAALLRGVPGAITSLGDVSSPPVVARSPWLARFVYSAAIGFLNRALKAWCHHANRKSLGVFTVDSGTPCHLPPASTCRR